MSLSILQNQSASHPATNLFITSTGPRFCVSISSYGTGLSWIFSYNSSTVPSLEPSSYTESLSTNDQSVLSSSIWNETSVNSSLFQLTYKIATPTAVHRGGSPCHTAPCHTTACHTPPDRALPYRTVQAYPYASRTA